MSRFASLYEHFQRTALPALQALTDAPQPERLVYVYRPGVYSVYERFEQSFTGEGGGLKVEVNPAARLSYDNEVWFFRNADGRFEAYIDYQPEFRDPIFVDGIMQPLLQVRVKKSPTISGLND